MTDSPPSDPLDRTRRTPVLPNVDGSLPPLDGADPEPIDPGPPEPTGGGEPTVGPPDKSPEDGQDVEAQDVEPSQLHSQQPSQSSAPSGPGQGRSWAEAKRYEAEMNQVVRAYANAIGEAARKEHRLNGQVLLLGEAWHQGWTDEEMKSRLEDFSAQLERAREGLLVFRIYQRVSREYPDKPATQDELRRVVQSELDYYGYRRAPEGASGALPLTERQEAAPSSASPAMPAERASTVTIPSRPGGAGEETGRGSAGRGHSSGDLRHSGKRPSEVEAAIAVVGERNRNWTPTQWREREAAYNKRAKAEEQAETHAEVQPLEKLPDGTTVSIELKLDGSWSRRTLSYHQPTISEPAPIGNWPEASVPAIAEPRDIVGADGNRTTVLAQGGTQPDLYLDAKGRPFVYVPNADGKTLTPVYVQEISAREAAVRKSRALLEGSIHPDQKEAASELVAGLLEKSLITDQDVMFAERAYLMRWVESSAEESYERFRTILNERAEARRTKGRVEGEEGGRTLTQPEIDVVKDAFGSSVNLTDVTIIKGPGTSRLAAVAFSRGHPAITINNKIYVRDDRYASDFAGDAKGVNRLVHEIDHVRQYQLYGEPGVYLGVAAGAIRHGPKGAYRYYTRKRANDEESLEGQSQIAGDYAQYRETGILPEYDVNGEWITIPASELEAWAKGSGLYEK